MIEYHKYAWFQSIIFLLKIIRQITVKVRVYKECYKIYYYITVAQAIEISDTPISISTLARV